MRLHYTTFLLLLFYSLFLPAQPAKVDSSAVFVVQNIFMLGNKKTNESIILRELTFKKGDNLPFYTLSTHFEKSEKQLLNTDLFNAVDVFKDSNQNVYVIVKEDWYIYPIPILQIADRNFNQWWLTKDFSRLNYGIRLDWYNFSGKADKLKLLLNLGYTKQVGLSYEVPFIDKNKHWGIGAAGVFSTNREVWAYPNNDKLVFFSDQNNFLIKRKSFGINTTYRKGYFDKHNIGISFLDVQIADTVASAEVNSNYLFGGHNKQQTINIAYSYTYDKRDIRGYPLKGYFIKTIAELDLYNPNKGFSGFNTELTAIANIYIPIAKNIYANSGITTSTSRLDKAPYIYTPSLGYANTFVRGYEYYVVDGKDYFLWRSNLKYALVNNKKYYSRTLPHAFSTVSFSCMAGIFYDLGFMHSPYVYANNRLPNTLLHGFGAGIDLIFFYDRVLRLEFTQNGLKEHGFYLSFYAPL